MSAQLSIFDTDILCGYCNNDPGPKENNTWHWAGFFDADTQQYVCNKCKVHHYGIKAKTEHAGMYSEIPVIVETERIKKDFINNHKKSKK